MSDAAAGTPPEKSTAQLIEEAALNAAATATSFILGPGTVADIVSLAAKYGPEAITGIIGLFKKTNPTIADVEAAFAPLKPYAAYGISDKVLAPGL